MVRQIFTFLSLIVLISVYTSGASMSDPIGIFLGTTEGIITEGEHVYYSVNVTADYYDISLLAGDSTDFDLYVYNISGDKLASSTSSSSYEFMSLYLSGTILIDIYAYSGNGTFTFTISISPDTGPIDPPGLIDISFSPVLIVSIVLILIIYKYRTQVLRYGTTIK